MKKTNGEIITNLVTQDENYLILQNLQEGTVTIEVSLDWWYSKNEPK